MCTVNAASGEATVCDVARPIVRAALAAEPSLVVGEEPVPGQGTRVRIVRGDPVIFERCVRAAVAEVNR